MRRFKHLTDIAVFFLLAAAAIVALQSQERPLGTEWRYFGGDKGFTRYSALDQINRDNVRNLRIVWRRPAASDKLMQAFPDLRPGAYLRSTRRRVV